MTAVKTRVGAGGVLAAALGLLVLASPGRTLAAGPENLLPAGGKAPAFKSVDLSGAPFSLEEELAGGPIFLVFWSIF